MVERVRAAGVAEELRPAVTIYAVTQCTNQVGVCMVLGASSAEILLSFGKRCLALTLTGLAIGLGPAFAVRSMTNLLYGVRPEYFPTFTGVSLTVLAVAGLACFLPARRASRVDPVVALRNEWYVRTGFTARLPG